VTLKASQLDTDVHLRLPQVKKVTRKMKKIAGETRVRFDYRNIRQITYVLHSKCNRLPYYCAPFVCVLNSLGGLGGVTAHEQTDRAKFSENGGITTDSVVPSRGALPTLMGR